MSADRLDAPIGRRAVLVTGVAVAGALATTAGCGAGGPDAAPAAQPAPVGSAGTPLGAAAEVPVGGGRVFEALEVVVTQPSAGEFRGFSAVCTHTGCIVNRVVDGIIECPCHGSRYHLDGTVAAGPAPRALSTREVSVVNGQIVVT